MGKKAWWRNAGGHAGEACTKNLAGSINHLVLSLPKPMLNFDESLNVCLWNQCPSAFVWETLSSAGNVER